MSACCGLFGLLLFLLYLFFFFLGCAVFVVWFLFSFLLYFHVSPLLLCRDCHGVYVYVASMPAYSLFAVAFSC